MQTVINYSGAIQLENGTEAYCGAEGCRVFVDGGAVVSLKFAGWQVCTQMNPEMEVLGTRILRSPFPRMGGDSARAKSLNASAERREVAMAAMVERAAIAKVAEIWPSQFAA